MLRFIDATLGKWIRHFLFVLIRTYYALFYNVSCAGKELLQDAPGTLILATHVSRHDGPLISAVLYSTKRIRPVVHYGEYYHWLQWFPMWIGSAIPVSSPKSWPKERRLARKVRIMEVIHKVLGNGNAILLFPAGRVRRQPEEIVEPYLSGVYDILRAEPDTPMLFLRLGGLGKFQEARHDLFWSFLGIRKGRRHVTIDIKRLEGLDTSVPLAKFNAELERLLNTPLETQF